MVSGLNIEFSRLTLDFKSSLVCLTCILVLLYLSVWIGGGNYLFVAIHILCTLALSTILLVNIPTEKKISVKRLKYFLLVAIPVTLILIGKNLSYSSVSLVLVIGLVSGVVSIKMAKPFFEDNVDRLAKRMHLYLILILLVSLAVRIAVFATPAVPMGYDVPNYLLLSLKASKMRIADLLSLGLGFSGDAYRDNWNFSMLWLGVIAKLLNHFGLDLLLIPKVVIPAISAFSVIPVFLLTRELADDTTALYSSLVFSLLPSELLFCDLYKEILGEFFVILSLYLLVKCVKSRNVLNVLALLLSAILLWRVAITAFAKFILFSTSLLPVFAYTGKISGRITALVVLAIPIIPFLGTLFPVVSFPLSPVKPEISDPYTRYSFPIILLTDLTAFVLAFAGAYIFFSSESKLKNIYAAGFSILLSIAIYSGVLSGLLGYRIFPSSYYLNTFRFSLYLGLPISMLSGAFVSEVFISGVKSRMKNIVKYLLFISLILDLIVATYGGTTIHSPSRFYSYISEEDYKKLSSLEYSKYDHIIMVGDFNWSPDSKNFAVGNWIRYIVFSKTGVLPEEYDKMPDVNNSLLIIYDNSRILVEYKS